MIYNMLVYFLFNRLLVLVDILLIILIRHDLLCPFGKL